MKKFFALFLLFASSLYVANAGQRTQFQAKQIAESTLVQKLGRNVMLREVELARESSAFNAPSLHSFDDCQVTASSQLAVPYYVFNSVDDASFVVVSGSDLMPEVIGYGIEGSLPEDSNLLPATLLSWLQYVSEVEASVESDPSSATNLEYASAQTQPVSPLLTTQWGQDWPYNLQCPKEGNTYSVTGCMATSVSQVLKYHAFPEQFVGSYSYYDSGTLRSMDFEEHSFDYSLMLNAYSLTNSNTTQQQEVAELMHCVGHALSMDYSPSGSGAVDMMSSMAFCEHIGCTREATLYRAYFSLDEWNAILQSELQASRPVVFNGFTSTDGHSFVLDGVDSKGFYHVDWGWTGTANGYFDVSILNPEDRGIGASMSADGFANSQNMFVGICNPADNPKYYTMLVSTSGTVSSSKSKTTLGQSVSFSTKAFNNQALEFKGNVGVIIYDEEGNVFTREMSSNETSIPATTYSTSPSGYYTYTSYGEKNISYSYTFPTDMPEGKYRLYMCVQPTGSTDFDLIRVKHSRYSYREIQVSGNEVSVLSNNFAPNMEVTEWILNDGEEVLAGASNVKFKVKNNGEESLGGVFFLKLTAENEKSFEYESGIVTIPAHEEGMVSVDVVLPYTGNWKATVRVADICVSSSKYSVSGSTQFAAGYDPTLSAILSIDKELYTSDKVYSHGVGTFKIDIKNAGSDYEGNFILRIYSNRTSTNPAYLVNEFTCPVQVGANRVETVSLTGEVNIAFYSGSKTLYGRVYYQKGDEYIALASQASKVVIYGNNATGIEETIVEDHCQEQIFDLLGRPVSGVQLPEGLWVVDRKLKVIK